MNRFVNDKLRTTLRGASKMIQSGRLMELTTALQKSLSPGKADPAKDDRRPPGDVIDVEARVIHGAAEAARARTSTDTSTHTATHAHAHPQTHTHTHTQTSAHPRPAEPTRTDAPAAEARHGGRSAPQPMRRNASTDSDGRFVDGSFSNAAGKRAYKLYIPAGAGTTPLPMLVMLHGCTQNPDDFAAGTAANEIADESGFYVLYPAQAQAANMQKCWNWYQPSDQMRGQGEPSLIADMTRDVMSSYPVDPLRVYVAGLSAGGAMAVTMATTYPDLYAAAGAHSGLPYGAAHDMMSAFSAMRQGSGSGTSTGSVFVPTIVFHGDSDSTVNPCNGEQIVLQSKTLAPTRTEGGSRVPPRPPEVEKGRVPAGHAWTRTIYRDADGASLVEHWLIHGAGHAWSGGSSAGTYTDPHGPNATREMVRFFMDHPQRSRH